MESLAFTHFLVKYLVSMLKKWTKDVVEIALHFTIAS
jgi:hypothetical protein